MSDQVRDLSPGEFAEGYFVKVQDLIRAVDVSSVAQVITLLEKAWREGRTIFIAGNGGSASTASHMANDLSKTVLGMPVDPRKDGFKAIALTDNVALLTAWANDEGYEEVFSGQLRSLARTGDVLIVISVSGNSENLLRAAGQAQVMGLSVVGFLGRDGGQLGKMVDLAVVVPGTDYGPVEDIHLALDHLITAYFRQIIPGNLP